MKISDMFSWNPDVDSWARCTECLKKIGFEARFILPILPKKITCPYCDQTVEIIAPDDDDKGKKKSAKKA